MSEAEDARRNRLAGRWFVALLAAGLAARLLFLALAGLGLTPDEAYYWEMSRRPDWCYFAKGPLTAWLIRLAGGGASAFEVRLPAVLAGTLTLAFCWGLARRALGGARPALAALLLLHATPLFAAGSLLMTPDAPFLCCWAAALYFLARAGESDRLADWLACGAALGLGLWAKYSMLFFVPTLLLFLALAPARRRLLRRPGPWLALLVGCAFLAPLVAWNAGHDWVNLAHTAGKGNLERDLAARYLLESLGLALGLLSPVLALLALGAAGRALARARRAGQEGAALLAAAILPVAAGYALVALRTRLEGNWPAPGYLAAFLAVPLLWDAESAAARRRRRLAAAGGLFGGALTLGALALAALPRPPAWAPDKLAELRQWPRLAARAQELRAPERLALLADRYQVAAELAFYLPGNPRVFCAPEPEGQARNQYDLWRQEEDLPRGAAAVFVYELDAAGQPRRDLRFVRRAFAAAEELPPLAAGGRPRWGLMILRGFKGWENGGR